MKHPNRLLLAAVLFAGSVAFAQPYPIQTFNTAYVPISGGTPVTNWVVRSGTNNDEASAPVAIGFSFPFYGQSYTTVNVDSNGLVFFGPATCTSGCYTNRAIPSTTGTNVHNMIAAWWDDLQVGSGSVVTRQSPGKFEIEWRNVQRFANTTASLTFKITLYDSGSFEVHYGSITPGTATFTATTGFENVTGSAGAMLLTCNASCATANFPANVLYRIGEPVAPDLTVSSVVTNSFTKNTAGNFVLDVTATLRNGGQTAPANTAWKAYLSTNPTLDAADVLLHTSAVDVVLGGSQSPTNTATVNATMTSPNVPPVGTYYVLVEADGTQLVTEASENNNVGASGVLVNGSDAIAQSISGPAASGPGNPIQLAVAYRNAGNDPVTGTVRVLLSSDTTVSGNDTVIYQAALNLSGGQSVTPSPPLTINLPQNVPGGTFFYLLELQPNPADANASNNVVASSAKVTMSQAELVNLESDFVAFLTGNPTRVGEFGQRARLKVKVQNAGGANATNYAIGLVVSTDSTLSLLSDSIVYEHTVSLASNQTQTYDYDFPLPTKDKNGADFTTGTYYLFVVVDSGSKIPEINEGNNILAINGPVALRAPAADLMVRNLSAPATAGVGERITVQRTFENAGSLPAATFSYRYYASSNAIITSADVPLKILQGAALVDEGTLALAPQQADQTVETLELPASMAPGSYHIGVVLDFGETVAELDETNNTGASTPLNVLANGLTVSTRVLPDAWVGLPYTFRLAATNASASATWSLRAGDTLPAGLSLKADGTLEGTPTATSINTFEVVVTDDARQARALLVLRAVNGSSQLTITTQTLPAIPNVPVTPYSWSLAAAGGARPYTWQLIGGALPNGLRLSAAGAIEGAVVPGLVDGNFGIVVQVRDALGTRAQKELTVRLVAPGGPIIVTRSLPAALAGNTWAVEVAARPPDGQTLARPLKWTVGSGLPEGITALPQGDIVFLSGTPKVAAEHRFLVSVEDAKGRTASREFELRVQAGRLRVLSMGALPLTLAPGDEVNVQFGTEPSRVAKFELDSGALPPGLTLSEDGKLTGTVGDENAEGTWNFVVQARDETGASGFGPFVLQVQKKMRTGGCAASGAELMPLLAALGALALRRRRR